MRIDKLIERNRQKELVAIYRFIERASIEELYSIIAEIRCVHDNLCVFNCEHKSFDSVDYISINGDSVQLNVGEEINKQK